MSKSRASGWNPIASFSCLILETAPVMPDLKPSVLRQHRSCLNLRLTDQPASCHKIAPFLPESQGSNLLCTLTFFMPISDGLIGSSGHFYNSVLEIMKLISTKPVHGIPFFNWSFRDVLIKILVKFQAGLAPQSGLEMSYQFSCVVICLVFLYAHDSIM